MRFDVFLNPLAGNANADAVKTGVQRALFRCETRFWAPVGIPALHAQMRACVNEGTDGFIFCGGDGTVNTALKPLIELKREGVKLPISCVIPVGTANDLAFGSGISRRIDRAARALLEGRPKEIDVLEIISGDEKAYMITNGGIGLTAVTADGVNRFKHALKRNATDEAGPKWKRTLFSAAQMGVRNLGPKIYDLAVARELMLWNSANWRVRVSIPGRMTFMTKSPLVLVSNQAKIAGGFTTAPFTRNDDGAFNVLVVEPVKVRHLAKALLEMKSGHSPSARESVRFETSSVLFEADGKSPPFGFFGDGETLFRNVRKVEINCISPGVPFQVMSEEEEDSL